MKIRKGFVSNSSTSSFVCEICHRGHEEEESFVEYPSIRKCVNGHLFCRDHGFKELEKILDFEYNETDMHRYEELYESKYMNIPEEYCPICKKINIPDSHIIRFLLEYTNLTRADVESKIRNQNL